MRSDVSEAVEQETGRAATRTRRMERYPGTVVAMVALVAAGIAWIAIRPGPGWDEWVVLGAIVAVVVGAFIAINPWRGSPAGGTRRR